MARTAVNGTKVRQVPIMDPSPIIVPSTYTRAFRFHQTHIGPACECGDQYPCQDCAEEISALIQLLDDVARDAIRITSAAWERIR